MLRPETQVPLWALAQTVIAALKAKGLSLARRLLLAVPCTFPTRTRFWLARPALSQWPCTERCGWGCGDPRPHASAQPVGASVLVGRGGGDMCAGRFHSGVPAATRRVFRGGAWGCAFPVIGLSGLLGVFLCKAPETTALAFFSSWGFLIGVGATAAFACTRSCSRPAVGLKVA